MRIEAPLQGVSFPVSRRSTTTGETLARVHLTLIDLAVLLPGRFVFCSAPVIGRTTMAGWSVADAGINIVNPAGGPLDISWARKPADARLAAYQAATGESLNITRDGKSLVANSYGLLKLDTPIEAKGVSVSTFGEAGEWLKGQPKGTHLRCQSPFRESTSWAAYVNRSSGGKPFLYDSGTATNYWLADEMPDLGSLVAVLKGALPSPTGGEDAAEQKSALAARYEEAQAKKDEDPAQLLAWALEAVALDAAMLPSPKRTANNKVSIEQVVSAARVHKVMDLIGMTVRQNVMTGDFESRFEADGVLGFFFKEEDSEKAIAGLVHACSRCGLKGPDQIARIVVSRARDNRFSPVGEWIKSKPWDGRSRILELCETLIMRNPAHIPWRNLALRLWLIQTVAAIRNWENEVPTSVGHVLVLQGPKQGGNKSFWIEALLPSPWVSIGMSLRLDGPSERDAVSRVTSTPITELGELDHSFKRSETGALKNFLTAPKDKYRPPYMPKDETKPRGTSFAATLNPEGFLVDPTGARRFWPVGVIRCVLEHGIDMQQLWAEVWDIEEKNSVFWLIGEEQERMHDEISQQHAAPTEERDILDQLKYREQIYNVDAYVHASAKDLWEHHTGHGRRGSMVNYVNLNVGLEAAGYEGAKVKGKRGYWVPPYTSTLTAEQQAQLRNRFPVIQGGKKDE